MRYINKIMLPPLPGGSVELASYLRVGPQSPDPRSFLLTSFLDQHTAVEHATNHRVNTVLSGQAAEAGGIPVILDNGVEADLVTTPDDWPSIEDKLLALRQLKNKVFALTLTPLCLSLFQQSSDSA